MERYTVVGFMPTEFTDSRTGAVIRGTSVHCVSPMSSRGYGQKVDRFFMKAEIDCSALVIGDDIIVYFNRYGKPSGFEPIMAADKK